MAKYNLYAGLGGGFGGYQYHCTEDYDSREDAEKAARELAIEEYQSYEGMHGILSEGDIREQYCEENELTEDELTQEDEDEISGMYQEEIEGWLSYLVTTVEEDPNHDRYYKW